MSRRSEATPDLEDLTRKITWLQRACNLEWLWPLIISWSTSFIPASVCGPMLIWDLVCLKVSTCSLPRVWDRQKHISRKQSVKKWSFYGCRCEIFCIKCLGNSCTYWALMCCCDTLLVSGFSPDAEPAAGFWSHPDTREPVRSNTDVQVWLRVSAPVLSKGVEGVEVKFFHIKHVFMELVLWLCGFVFLKQLPQSWNTIV